MNVATLQSDGVMTAGRPVHKRWEDLLDEHAALVLGRAIAENLGK
jgi:hypothetical protein